MGCKGLHCPGCRHGGGRGPAALAILVIGGAAVARPAAMAAEPVIRVLTDVLAAAAIIAGAAVGLALIAGLTVAGIRPYGRLRHRPRTYRINGPGPAAALRRQHRPGSAPRASLTAPPASR
jgi:hypothetical protein